MSIGLSELLVIIIIVIALFKPEKLSDYARMAGVFLKRVRQAAKSITEVTEPVRDAIQPVTDLKKDIDTQITEVKNEFKNEKEIKQ
jgi:sec-independent protein translocase protein TatB